MRRAYLARDGSFFFFFFFLLIHICPCLRTTTTPTQIELHKEGGKGKLLLLPKGKEEVNVNTKLNEFEVMELRRLAKRGWSLMRLADAYGIGYYTVRDIVVRKTWKWVKDWVDVKEEKGEWK